MGYRLDRAYGELLNQFRDAPGILSFLEAIFNRIEDTDGLLAALLTKRDLESAEGVWLDILGAIVGVRRPVALIPDENIFTMKNVGDPDDPDLSFGDAVPPTSGGYFQTLAGVRFPDAGLVDDDTFRVFLKAKIYSTSSSPSLPGIGRFISEGFGIDPADFEITVPKSGYIQIELDSAVDSTVRFAIRTFAPVAAGVDLYVV